MDPSKNKTFDPPDELSLWAREYDNGRDVPRERVAAAFGWLNVG